MPDAITEGDAVGVLLSNRPARVWVDQADFDRIVKAHGNRTWAWVQAAKYVKLKVDQTVSVPVARLVVGEGGRFIRYADGDRLNLRRANLTVEEAVRPGGRVKQATAMSDMVMKREPPKQRALHAPDAKVRPYSAPALPPPPPPKATALKQGVQVVGTIKRSPVP